ncbi:hypothetical protein ACTXT7_014484 [Hymenolepis weldensis]
MTETTASSKKNRKRNENPQKNLHGSLIETSTKTGKKRKQHPDLVHAQVNELKNESKVKAMKKTENGDLYFKTKGERSLWSQPSEANALNQEKERGQFSRSRREAMLRKLKAVVKNF